MDKSIDKQRMTYNIAVLFKPLNSSTARAMAPAPNSQKQAPANLGSGAVRNQNIRDAIGGNKNNHCIMCVFRLDFLVSRQASVKKQATTASTKGVTISKCRFDILKAHGLNQFQLLKTSFQ